MNKPIETKQEALTTLVCLLAKLRNNQNHSFKSLEEVKKSYIVWC